MSGVPDRRAWGRIGGLTAWSRHGSDRMLGPAHAGFRRRFERMVDPDGSMDPAERARRAERALRAHMLQMARRSAEVRRKRAASRGRQAGGDRDGSPQAGGDGE
jgi:hypothetical protein